VAQRPARACLAALGLLLAVPARARAEWQFKPFLGATFGASTTFYDLDQTVGNPHVTFGATGLLLGEFLGVEGDFAYVPGFFTGGVLVSSSGVTTLTGNVVVAVPRHTAGYSLRPYFVGGAGLMHATSSLFENTEGLSATLPAMDLGGGATGFLSTRVGLNWDVRYFRSIGTGQIRGQSLGPEQLSFWRATMAVVIRY
jgi:hypothetical protein